ncbi:MAG TPA: nickel pincer cofactor biosynthesis protein LarC [Terriglobales bacterium]|nr:nickel pincer cofactor biosynthesis protein LarC [Terriglobales bacterium]
MGLANDQRLTTKDRFIPMRIAYIDCFSGMSGDMFLGALIDAGVSPEVLENAVAALDVGARLEITKVNRSGITATKVDVLVNGQKEIPSEMVAASGHEHSHAHEHHEHDEHHAHTHVEAHAHSDTHSQPSSRAGASAPHVHGRSLKEIKAIIGKAQLSEHAKQTAIRIFEALGAAESKIHNMDIGSVHFHEVGAVDAMVDIVGAAVGAEALGVGEFVCSPLNVGGGTVKCAHGVFPVPAPATVELLAGAPVYSSGMQVELLTPTGAAIVKTLATRFGAFPEMKIEKSGYGAGTRDFPGNPNVVRLVVGESAASLTAKTAQDTVSVVEANLDDLNPQVFGYVMDRLLSEGALDVFGMPVQMKKNRPGTLLTVLCKPEDAAKLTQIIFAETTTLGVRRREEQRQTLARRWVSVPTPWGDVRMKVASLNGTITNYAPEYEDCRRIASERHLPLKTVMQEATTAYLRKSEKP